jgi:RNase P/RNase MRP subunit p30
MTRCPRCHHGEQSDSDVSFRLCPEHAVAVLADLRAWLRTSGARRTRLPESEDGLC